MKKYFWIALIILLGIVIYSLSGEQDNSAYIAEIEEKISSRKRFLQHNDQSPFNMFDVAYRDPQYFPINPDYRVTVRVNRISGRETVLIGNSDGKDTPYLKYAYLNFQLLGKDLQLLVLKPVGFSADNTLFCAFADDTSGESTYGAGRYLDVAIGKSDKITIDFNLAYNPYCAYVDDFACPLPPAENILAIPIEAGEKDFKHGD